MELRALLITADSGLADLLRPQVENQGGLCQVAESYDAARASFEWANAVLLDLELPEGGADALARLRLEQPEMPVAAVAPTASDAEAVVDSVERVLVEPLSIADVVDAVRSLTPRAEDALIDLRTGQVIDVTDDAPWWATR